jgi:pyruvate, water dikinase
MGNILWFNEVTMSNVEQVGGKGASLGEMVQNNFPVPNGFIVTAEAYFKFVEETGIKQQIIEKIDSIDVEKTAQLENISKEVRLIIRRTPMPSDIKQEVIENYQKLNQKENDGAATLVAVRSSATAEDLPDASFAGQQETYLNIMGNEEVLLSVQKCWASLFTARAVYYRKKQGFGTENVGLCAVVQKMVQSDVSGVMFTADPAGDETKIIIEAGFGLGETIVAGSITPDNYTINKENLELINKKINHQNFMLTREQGKNTEINLGDSKAETQKLSDEKIIELAGIGKKIEEHYKKPMDVEWAMENNKLYIVQARPITTLNSKNVGKNEEEIKEEEEEKEELEQREESGENALLDGLAASPGIISGFVKVVPNIDDIVKVNKGDILVTKMTSPSWVPVMKKAAGIITDEGGRTCHAAIVSRELGIPCVVGTKRATIDLKDGQQVTVDGYNGKVFGGETKIEHEEKVIEVLKDNEIDKIEKMLAKIVERKETKSEIKEKIVEVEEQFGKKKFESMSGEEQKVEEEDLLEILKGLSIKVKVNVALPDAAEKAAATKADGVGLLRAEHMITSSGMHPAEFIRQDKSVELKNKVKEGIKLVAEKFSGPVWFRTFDARSDEFRELQGGEKELNEDNPMLGWHGIRRDIESPAMFKAQLLAIKELRQSGLKNVGIMLPFVQSLEEVIKAKELAREVGLQEDVDFGVMIETPASVWIIDEIIPHVRFISFGTNDLTQLTLGMDRNNEKVQKDFTELHPAILREMEYVIKKCKKAGVITSICGQAASNPEMVQKLVWFGIDSVSANIDAVENIRKIVMLEEKKKILEFISKNPDKSEGFFHKLLHK